MPTKSKLRYRLKLALLTEFLYAAAFLTEDYDNEELGDDLDEDRDSDVDEIIELAALNSLASVLQCQVMALEGHTIILLDPKTFFYLSIVIRPAIPLNNIRINSGTQSASSLAVA